MNTFVAWCGKEPKTILRECALTSGLGNLWGNIAAPSKLALSQHGLITWALMPFHKVEKAAWMRREKTLKYRELVFYFVCAHITFFLQIWFASLLPFKKILKFFDFPLCSAFFACLGFSSRLKKYSSLIPRLDDHKLAFLISKPGLAGCWTSNLPPHAKFLVGKNNVLMFRDRFRRKQFWRICQKVKTMSTRRRRFLSVGVDIDVDVGVARGGFSFHYLFKHNTCLRLVSEVKWASPFNSSCFRFCFCSSPVEKRTEVFRTIRQSENQQGKNKTLPDFWPKRQQPFL